MNLLSHIIYRIFMSSFSSAFVVRAVGECRIGERLIIAMRAPSNQEGNEDIKAVSAFIVQFLYNDNFNCFVPSTRVWFHFLSIHLATQRPPQKKRVKKMRTLFPRLSYLLSEQHSARHSDSRRCVPMRAHLTERSRETTERKRNIMSNRFA